MLVRGTDVGDGSAEVEIRGETLIMHGVYDPKIPLTLEKFGAEEWEWSREEKLHPLIVTAVRGRPIVTYVSRPAKKDRDSGGNPNTTLGAGEWRDIHPVDAKAGFPAA